MSDVDVGPAGRDAPNSVDGAPRLILGTVVSNGGDAAILHAQIALLDRALGTARTQIEDNDPALAREIFPELDVLEPGRTADTIRRVAGALRRVERPLITRLTRPLAYRLLPWMARRITDRRLDRALAQGPLVFYTGGTSLIEKYDLGAKLGHIRHAIGLGREVVLLPQSVGPFRDPSNIAAIKEIVDSAALVLLRDERSLRHLREIGASTDRVRVVPDVVFGLTTQADIDRLAQARIPARGPRVALGLRDCRKFFDNGDPDELQRLLELQYAELAVSLVRDRDAEVTFVSTCQGVDRYWTDDSEVSLAVFDRLPEDVKPSCNVDRAFHDTEALRSLLAGHDLVVANRLHGAILTLSVGVPVVPVEYEFKTREVFSQLGQESSVYAIDDVAGRSLAEHVDRFFARWESQSSATAAALQKLVDGAWSTADMIERSVSNKVAV